MLTGVDVSHHQGEIAWPQVRAAGYDFMLCKVTQGLGFEDARWRANRDGARAAGLVPGCYHFLERDSGGRQARRFAALVGDPAGHLVALDAETPGARPDPTYADVLDFADEWRTVSGGHPLLLYTGRWWWVGHLGDPPAPADVAGLWNSQYNDAPFAAYGGWERETVRQHTSAATVPGVAGSCDANRFAGTLADLLVLTGPQEDAMPLSAEDITAVRQVVNQVVKEEVGKVYALLAKGDDPDPATGDTHPDNLQRVRKDIASQSGALSALEMAVAAVLQQARANGSGLTSLGSQVAQLGTAGLTQEQIDLLARLLHERGVIAGSPTYTTAGPVRFVPEAPA
jgi:GH25 family lysozyme M1 (1,4-beta-N-acetylmuramidase)